MKLGSASLDVAKFLRVMDSLNTLLTQIEEWKKVGKIVLQMTGVTKGMKAASEMINEVKKAEDGNPTGGGELSKKTFDMATLSVTAIYENMNR